MEANWDADKYIEERVKQYQGWYDKKSITAKSRYLSMRAFSVIAGAIVPVLINISYDPHPYDIHVIKVLVTLMSLLVVVSVSLESVFHYREQWKNYRSTEQALGHEIIAFRSATSAYSRLDPNDAYRLLVERIEEAIRSENAATLNVMTMASEPDASRTPKI